MYAREYDNKVYTFEPSGGLLHSALVMQDFETNSYWSIMTGDVIGGKLKGTRLKELPVAKKMQWKDWKKLHPNTLVLSVNGQEDIPRNPYISYFDSEEGFRRMEARDKRLRTKEPIYAFMVGNEKYAIPLKAVEGGKVFDLGEVKLFLYRPRGAAIFYSTIAYFTLGKGFNKRQGKWYDLDSGCEFNPAFTRFEGGNGKCPQRFEGFDTFWYNWSLTHPDTRVLTR